MERSIPLKATRLQGKLRNPGTYDQWHYPIERRPPQINDRGTKLKYIQLKRAVKTVRDSSKKINNMSNLISDKKSFLGSQVLAIDIVFEVFWLNRCGIYICRLEICLWKFSARSCHSKGKNNITYPKLKHKLHYHKVNPFLWNWNLSSVSCFALPFCLSNEVLCFLLKPIGRHLSNFALSTGK